MAIQFEGVQNRVAVAQMIANESLYRLSMNLVFPRISNRTYQHYFDDSIGDTVTVKRPYKARAQTGRIMRDKSALIDKTVEISIDQRHHFAIETVDEDHTLRIEDYGERYLEVGAEELAYVYDTAGGEELSKTFFFHEGGSGSDLDHTAGQQVTAHASKVAIPRKRRFAVIDPYAVASISEEVMALDAPEMVQGAIRDMYRGKYAGWNLIESNFISPLDCAAVHSSTVPAINGTNAAARTGDSIITDGWGGSGSRTVLKKGQLIQIAGVYEVQPRGDRRSTGNLQTFVVTEDVVTSNASATIPIYPEIIGPPTQAVGRDIPNPGEDVDGNRDFDGGNDEANLNQSAFQTVNAIPANNARITIVGMSAGESARSFRQTLFMCGDALEYINVKLKTPKSAFLSGSQVDDETGLAITYTSDWNQEQYTEVDRMDILFGTKNIYPELGIRHIGDRIGG
ncbi:MAG: hypothetical protein OXC91_02045 [Rhodobacteraceae bacterium]|nr:hypothetical protein [Paracoccaceae bacterium]